MKTFEQQILDLEDGLNGINNRLSDLIGINNFKKIRPILQNYCKLSFTLGYMYYLNKKGDK